MDCIYIALLSKALYSIASHSPIITPTAVSTMQGNKQHIRDSSGTVRLRDTLTPSYMQSPGIEPATDLTSWATAALDRAALDRASREIKIA